MKHFLRNVGSFFAGLWKNHKKQVISFFIMIFAITMFFVGFYVIPTTAMYKGYVVVIGLILTVYGFINILT